MKKVNLFIIGAAKSGTTALFDSFLDRNEILCSSIKEPNYFSEDIDVNLFRCDYKRSCVSWRDEYFGMGVLPRRHISFIRSIEQYNRLFEFAAGQAYLCEASTTYLFSSVAAKNIFDYNPDSKIIAILRNPVDRAISHFKMNLVSGLYEKNTGFKDAICRDVADENKGWGSSHLYVELGEYSSQVERYREIFPREQLLIMPFWALWQVDSISRLVGDFLGIDGFELKIKRSNESLAPKNGFVDIFAKLYRTLVADYGNSNLMEMLVKRNLYGSVSVRDLNEGKSFLRNLMSREIDWYNEFEDEFKNDNPGFCRP